MHPVGDMGFPTKDCPGTFGDLPTYGPPRLLADPKKGPLRAFAGTYWEPTGKQSGTSRAGNQPKRSARKSDGDRT